MPLSDEQRAKIEEEAKRRGIDPAKLIAAADKAKQTQTSTSKVDADVSTDEAPPNLYMYHLPFVRVNEVRERWLKLPPLTDGDMLTGEWLAKHGTATPTDGES